MDPATLVAFTIALALAAASPGPGVVAVVAKALGTGFRGALPMVLGLVLGDLTYLSFAAFGLAALAQTFGTVFLAVKWVGAGYLAWLAVRLWTAAPTGARLEAAGETGAMRTFLGGLALTLGNPKVMVFYLALLPSLVDLPALTTTGFAELAGVVVVVLLAVIGGYAAAAARARDLFRSPGTLRWLDRAAGTMMAGAAAAVVARS
ncbi:LysE family translocator [Prosthecomicrobium sp. N25]|uniref:LysE family translocator n=1 Tax=Prosthecomicrobium sp. N25 TaxID=3129254 RepID=UPI0030787619